MGSVIKSLKKLYKKMGGTTTKGVNTVDGMVDKIADKVDAGSEQKNCLLLDGHHDSELDKFVFNCSKEEFQNAINNQVPLVFPRGGSGGPDSGSIDYVHLTALVTRPRDPETDKLKPDEFYSDDSVRLTGMYYNFPGTTTAELKLLYISVNMNDMSYNVNTKTADVSYK